MRAGKFTHGIRHFLLAEKLLERIDSGDILCFESVLQGWVSCDYKAWVNMTLGAHGIPVFLYH